MSRTGALLSLAILLVATRASATTNQFRGVNWADSRDNFQSGVLYVSGLSSSDTYSSALATGTSVMTQFESKLGANGRKGTGCSQYTGVARRLDSFETLFRKTFGAPPSSGT